MFATSFYILDESQREYDETNVSLPGTFSFWLVDAFTVPYAAAIGEYEYGDYENMNQAKTLTIFFVVSTFLINIVFLNMLIAIMSDTHA